MAAVELCMKRDAIAVSRIKVLCSNREKKNMSDNVMGECDKMDSISFSSSSGSMEDSCSSSRDDDDSSIDIDEQHKTSDQEDIYAAATRSWVKKVPIGLGLCPWAGKSNNRGLLQIVTCDTESPVDVVSIVEKEIQSLTQESTPSLSTTLIVCPHIKAWEEFNVFDAFVRSGIKQHLQNDSIMQNVTLVAFHPKFNRWYGLPNGISVGTMVQSHYGIIGQKSLQTATATIIETNNKAFGLRKVKVRYHDALEGVSNQEQYVPTDWIDFSNCKTGDDDIEEDERSCNLPLLPDNIMHQSPHPTIHLIANSDLASLCIRDISRVKRLNSQRMAKLGWDGVEELQLGTYQSSAV